MKINIPSIQQIGRALLDIGIRFPSTTIVTIVGTVFALYLVDNKTEAHLNIVFTCLLGLSFTLAITLLAERYLSSNGINTPANFGMKIAVQIIGLILLTFYYLSLPYDMGDAPHYVGYRLGLFILSAHFAVAIAPFLGGGSLRGFWRYNQMLFVRFLTAVLYSATLFAGLSVAIVAIENLFNVHFDFDIYAKLFIILAGLFNTFFFLYGIPRNLELFERDNPYPWGLKLFTQYVLLPLVTVYLLILYAYTIKIIGQGHLPEGWVSYLVLCFSVAGILSLLLIWPLRDDDEYDWVRWFSRGYFIALVPLIVLLFVAVVRRMSDYGLTINRYLLVVLSLWLAGITIYFIFSRVKNIKILPLSLSLVAFLSAFGPWGAFYISQKNQIGQLKQLLLANNMLDAEGKIIKASKPIAEEQSSRMRSIVSYLYYTHGPDALNDIGAKSAAIADSIPSYSWPDSFMSEYGMYSPTSEGNLPRLSAVFYAGHNSIYLNNEDAFNVWIDDFNAYWSEESQNNTPDQIREFAYKGRKLILQYNNQNSTLSLLLNNKPLWNVAIDTVAGRIKQKHYLKNNYGTLTPQEMTLRVSSAECSGTIYFNNIEISDSTILNFTADIGLFIK